MTVSTRIKSYGKFLFQKELYRNQSINSQCKSIEWFQHKRVSTEKNFRKDFNLTVSILKTLLGHLKMV